VEAIARRASPSRSRAWLGAYSLLGAAALIDGMPKSRKNGPSWALWFGVPLVLAGYPLGCAVLRHQPSGPPPDPLAIELAAVAGVIAPAEELTWGGLIEPALGVPVTAALFATKHVVIDGKWRRTLGLAAFWIGLGLVRSRSPRLALGLHMAVNASGVLLGHLNRQDSF